MTSSPGRKPRAVCRRDDCRKVLVVAAAPGRSVPEREAVRFPPHRRPSGGMCDGGGSARHPADLVRKADRVHDCRRCRELPEQPEGWSRRGATRSPYRPDVPRPVKARGYCASHLVDVDREQRAAARAKYRADTYGITPEQHDQLVAAQGGGCACGSTHSHSVDPRTGRTLGLATDHDHAREAECVAAGRHPAGHGCPRCVRGALGRRCNTEIVGRFTSDQLRRLADYMDSPTAQQLGWWDDPEGES